MLEKISLDSAYNALREPLMPRLAFKPKFDKIVELLVYLASKRPHADHYQAVKLLYLADREHMNEYGRPITFETYYALPYGPVATHALDMIKGDRATLAKAGIEKLPIKIRKLDKVYYLTGPERDVDFDLFSKSDIKIFDRIIKKYGKKSFDELYEVTHSHHAYKNAWKQRGTKRAFPMSYEDMLLAGPIRKAGLKKEDVIQELESVAPHM
jgi:uncharacterized phage-associated protein